MRLASKLPRVLCLALAGALGPATAIADGSPPARLEPLPIPSVAGKTRPPPAGQTRFRVPLRFARVEAFYRARFEGDAHVSLSVERGEEGRTLTLASSRPDDAWLKAVVHEGAVDTVIEVTPGVHLTAFTVDGHPPPQMQLVIPRSDEVVKMANSIDHMPRHH